MDEIQELQKKLEIVEAVEQIENLVVDNKIEFRHKEAWYRVRRPNFADKEELRIARMKKFIELSKDPEILSDKKLREMYAKDGDIDIPAIEEKMAELIREIENMQMKLLMLPQQQQALWIVDIEKMKGEFVSLSEQRTEYLSYSRENELAMYCNTYLSYLVCEKQTADHKYGKFCDTYEQFIRHEDEKLISLFTLYATYLLFRSPAFTE